MEKLIMQKYRFTLLEILIVISVIAILITIITPAINNAREKSRRSACKNNLRDLGIAMNLYASDNFGYYPLGLEAIGTNQNLFIYGTINGGIIAIGYLALHLQDIARNPKIYKCPSRSSHNVDDDIYIKNIDTISLGSGQAQSNLSYPYIPNEFDGNIKNLHKSLYGNRFVIIRDKIINHNSTFGNILFGSGVVKNIKANDYDSSTLTKIATTTWLSSSEVGRFLSTNPRAFRNLDTNLAITPNAY